MTTRRRRGEDGVSTVEFALVFPLFMLLVGIGVYFAWIYYVQSQVDNAADRAARYAAVGYTTTTPVTKNIDQNGNVSKAGVTLGVGLTIVGAYQTTETTTTYHYCVSKVVDKVNADLASGSVTSNDVELSDGAGVLAPTAVCAKPQGYVKVKVSKNFTNPFSYLLAPFTGATSDLTVTGTGRARVEAE
jgi:Flp pilus assembly protein TadG